MAGVLRYGWLGKPGWAHSDEGSGSDPWEAFANNGNALGRKGRHTSMPPPFGTRHADSQWGWSGNDYSFSLQTQLPQLDYSRVGTHAPLFPVPSSRQRLHRSLDTFNVREHSRTGALVGDGLVLLVLVLGYL